jgi:phage tail-like protein
MIGAAMALERKTAAVRRVVLTAVAASLALSPAAGRAAPQPSPSPSGRALSLVISGSLPDIVVDYLGGLGAENEVIEHLIMSPQGPVMRKVPGQLRTGSLRVRRLRTGNELFAWRQQVVEQGSDFRKDVTVKLVDLQQGEVVAEFDLAGAWPSRYAVSAEVGAVDPKKGIALETETVTIVYDAVLRH